MPTKRIPIAVQLYSVRGECQKDLPGTLKAVAKMGYEGVEFAGYFNYSAADLRKMVEDCGLKVAGTHIGVPSLLDPEFERTVEFNQTLGNAFLIIPGLPPEFTSSIDAWKKTAGVFNKIADRLASHGMFTGYHNHHTEFTAVNGQIPWDVFFGATSKRVVMQADTGNALHGGADVVAYIEKYPGRALTVHLKEYSKTNDKALVGEGDIDWKRAFRVCESVGGTQWYIVEQESYAFPPLECISKCLQNLKKMGR